MGHRVTPLAARQLSVRAPPGVPPAGLFFAATERPGKSDC